MWKLPESLWSGNAIRIPEPLRDAFYTIANRRGWPGNSIPDETYLGAVGGAQDNESRDHYLGRFFASSVRAQFLLCDPWKKSPDLTALMMERLGEGRLTILDLAAGHGGGTLGFLTTLQAGRLSRSLPSWPLSVDILALDISQASLELYEELVAELAPNFDRAGMKVHVRTRQCDLTVSGLVDACLDEALLPTGQNPQRLLAVVSAISGLKEETHEAVALTLNNVAARLSHRNSAWVWIEPQMARTKRTWKASSLVDRVMRWFPPYGNAAVVNSPINFTDGIPSSASKITWADPRGESNQFVVGRVCAMGSRSRNHDE